MKRLLIIRADKDIYQEAIDDICLHTKHYNIDSESFDVSSAEELQNVLEKNGDFDYIYFAGHGKSTCFGTENGEFNISWEDIGEIICNSSCLRENAIIMMYCCKGGLNTIAYQLMAACNNIEYVCGAKQNVKNIDLIIGFNVFLYNIQVRNIDPVIAAEKSTRATEIRFECFDRTEVESNPLYYYKYCVDCDTENSQPFIQP